MATPKYFLFGSVARGDADAASDKDVLIIYESEPSLSSRQQAKRFVAEQLQYDCAYAEYTESRLAQMFAEGHLFAWHLHHEARTLHGAEIEERHAIFPKPAPYLSAQADVLNFISLLKGCVRAVENQTTSLVYEAGLAYVAIRNVGMSLSAAVLARPEFDRYVPFKVARALQTLPPCNLNSYDVLVAARHSSQRGLGAPDLDASELRSVLVCAQNWAEDALEIAYEVNID